MMVYTVRHEDQGLTMRLYALKADAWLSHGASAVYEYGPGWIVQNKSGRWQDENGIMPSGWKPDPAKLKNPTPVS